jgi:hypothetical protein
MVRPPGDHLRLYFGPSCEKPTGGGGLSPLDLDGIAKGKAMPGMTKQGVIYAIGYPPPHETPDLERDTWTYWTSRFDTIEVSFADGIVTAIED